jgi:hypothetical protein
MWGDRCFWALLLLSSSSAAAAADQPAICADRPGKATATCTVPARHWQLEIGLADWSLQKGSGERDTELALGETNAKYGVSDRSDIEIDFVPWQRTSSHQRGFHDDAGGIGDLSILWKQRLTPQDRPVEVSVVPFLKVPTAREPLGNGKWEGGILAPIGYSMGQSGLSIALTPEIDIESDIDRHGYHAQMAQVASLGWQASERLTVSAEIWGAWDWDPAETTRQYSADAAIAYLANKDLQLDAGANFGLNRATPDVEVYTGISLLF